MNRYLPSVLLCFIATISLGSFNPVGIYGACNCAEDEKHPRLIINEDNTFLYKKNPGLTYAGIWTKKGKYVYLMDKHNSYGQRWKLDQKGSCIKSHEALLFLRICKK